MEADHFSLILSLNTADLRVGLLLLPVGDVCVAQSKRLTKAYKEKRKRELRLSFDHRF